ncbi:SDR family oxidoreductase [Polymorphobacter arshaanensis]|uniref:NADP-dependent 3-hydroxy acid dehydrogenase YdfG n=1 Tax=Glacieibacterium arshaanense TaxID=2511025 RepID=A0A4Y9ELP5_9SPHN|nr:SDR family oxidoreductase [Polymorphobacter arshaanensis]TFU02922.1 SDR family oxidoreductase [Polymorphobacter arshaanensis]
MSSIIPGRAVVTGASSGIGAVYADRLATRGHALLIVARRGDRLDALAARLRAQYGADVTTLVADLETSAGLAEVEAAVGNGQLSILVNNAGAGGLGSLAAVSADALERTIKLNIVALTRLSHAALARFREQGAGTLVNIASVMALAPSPSGAVYSGSKAYVLNFTRSLAFEYADTAVRVQAVMPGPIRTEFFTSQGLSDSIFPDSSFISADQLVDAALAGLDAGETVTIPSLENLATWDTIETARKAFMAEIGSGAVASRYRVG